MSIRNDLQKLYIGYLGRAADKPGLDYWEAQINAGAITLDDLRINWVNEQPEYLSMYGGLTRSQVAGNIYQNLFKRAPDDAGLDYWVSGEGAAVPVDRLILAFMAGAQGTDVLELDNQVTVANYYTANIGDLYSIDTARNILKMVSYEANSVAAAIAQVDAWIASGVDGKSFTLTVGQDTIIGTGADDVFKAPIVQNQLGAVTNTFESGDYLDGGAGRNILEADLTFTVSGLLPVGPAISATTKNIQEVYFRAQSINVDTGGQFVYLEQYYDNGFPPPWFDNGFVMTSSEWRSEGRAIFEYNPTIDAEKMTGVEQWWSQNSRSDLYIEDVRSLPEDSFIGMRGTDHLVSYKVDFDAATLLGRQFEADSTLVFQLVDQDNPELELQEFPIQGIRFDFNGESYNLISEAMKDADTYEDFVAALEAALEDAGLGGLEVLLQSFTDPQGNEGAQIVITDPEAGIFANPGINFDQEELGGAGQLYWRSTVGAPEVIDKLIETNVVLDLVGRMDQGGILDIGGMSNKGVEVFNVLVGDSSWLTALQSTSRSVDPDTGSFDHLQEVYVSHLPGAQGDLVLGWQAEARQTDFIDPRFTNVTNLPTGGRVLPNGLWDVRVFDAEGFTGGINIGVSLTEDSFARYLDFAQEPVQFSYLGGDGGNLFTFAIDGDLASDPDFRLEMVGGASNDRFNLVGAPFDLQYIEIDGGGGDFNTLETSSDIGLTADPTTIPMAFENIQKLVLAGSNDVDAGMENLPGVEELWIATENGNDSNIWNLKTYETEVIISGKNQTSAPAASNNDQFFGTITFADPKVLEASDVFTLTLGNTARNNARLEVEQILVVDGPGGDATTNQARVMSIVSDGRRDTDNVVQNFAAPRVTDLSFEGTQDLAIHVSDMATLPISAGQTPPLTISGEDLEGDLVLAMNAGILTRGDLDVVTGTTGENDLLALYGAVGTIAPTVSEFETIQFGWLGTSDLADLFGTGTLPFSGTYNAANTTGVSQDSYVIGRLGGDFTLTGLRNGDVVQVGDASAGDGQIVGVFGQQITLNGTGTLNLNAIAELGLANFNVGGSSPYDFYVNGFTTVNVDVDRSNSVADEDLFTNFFTGDSVRTINLTGGNAAPDVDISLEVENALNTALTRIDVSGFEGEFITNGWNSQFGTNATIVGNKYAFEWDMFGDSFGQSVGFFGTQLGTDDDYEIDDDITLSVEGLIEGEPYATTLTLIDIGEATKDDTLIAVRDAINALPADVLGPPLTDYEVSYTATYVGGKFKVAFSVVDDEGNPVEDAFVTEFSFTTPTINLTEADALTEFITSFRWETDAAESGIVWEINGFQAFGQDGVDLGNQSIIDLRPLGVSSATDITIQSGDDFAAGFTGTQLVDLYGPQAAALSDADNVVVTSNTGLEFTILLVGVDISDLNNENFAGIA